ncbi:MAG TPA: NFACT RNA binding domain-containing protein [Armatimonadota bacterium]|nr:NFACT RNA binding domain-containing protein [Armatimonadota bacterium]
MTFDSVIMAAVADELNKRLANGKAVEVRQPEPLDVVLTIRQPGMNHQLLISADAESPRIHLTSVNRPNPKTPPNFCMVLRKYLKGARFEAAEQVDFDRILRLSFLAYDGERFTLAVEIMGKHSNAILINGVGRILGAVKLIPKQKSRYREILPGREYVPPPSQGKLNPLTATKEEMEGLSPDADAPAAWLVKTFTGMSPFLARELVLRDKDLAKELVQYFARIRKRDFSPVLITDDAGQSIGFYAFPSVQFPKANQHGRPSISTVADMCYMTALPRRTFEQAKDEFIRRLQRELKAAEEALETIQAGIRGRESAERLKQIGDLILAQAGAIPKEAETAELTDYYDPNGVMVTVQLDPTLSAAENAERYFRKYQKAVSGAEALRDRLSEAKAKVRLLKKVLSSADSIATEGQIQELQKVLEEQGIHARKQEAPEKKKVSEFAGHRISRVQSDGWEILVGQNSEANDYLLTRVARPSDWWVHVKASPSAHVVIRTNGKPEAVPRSVLHAAAELAARHSDSKHSSLVPVDYTLRKYVRKPKGAPAGKALYQNERTIFITPSGK